MDKFAGIKHPQSLNPRRENLTFAEGEKGFASQTPVKFLLQGKDVLLANNTKIIKEILFNSKAISREE